MPPTVISVENLSKSYRLGQIGTGTLSHDINVWWARLRGKPNPMLRIGETDHGNRNGETIWALKDVSFQVEQGEVLGIIGRNGAGKSTLLKILSRVTAPTSGVVKVKGRIASLLEVGTGFHPDLTGRENIYLNGAILGMTKEEVRRKFDEIVDFAEIEKFIDTPVKRYSSGMYVRLAFAVAAHLDPEILLVDEVLAVGDAAFQKKCLGKMGAVAKEGRTVLFVSHNMASVENLCTQGFVLEAGQKTFEGSIRNSISFYMNQSNKLRSKNDSTGRIIFDSIILVNDSGEIQDKFKIGEPIVFRFGILAHPDYDLILGIGINNGFGSRITTIISRYTDFSLPATDKPKIVECKIDHLALAPGEYAVKFAAASSYGKDIEVVEEQNVFEIVASDYWKHGFLPSTSQGIIMAEHAWQEM
jgi:lipopolysaccharide transport system ATP-binding protein